MNTHGPTRSSQAASDHNTEKSEASAHWSDCSTLCRCLRADRTLRLANYESDVFTTGLVSTSERPGVTKRMQRLGIQRASAPNCANGLRPDETTPKVLAQLPCTFLHHSACSHDFRPET